MNGMSAVRRSAAAVGLLVLVGAIGATNASGSTGNRLTFYTFSRPVSLPGVTLSAGTYAFEVQDAETSGNIVLVRDRSRTRSYYLGFTHRTPRPQGWSERRQIVFAEGMKGEATPILGWYPVDNAMGYEFIYRR